MANIRLWPNILEDVRYLSEQLKCYSLQPCWLLKLGSHVISSCTLEWSFSVNVSAWFCLCHTLCEWLRKSPVFQRP